MVTIQIKEVCFKKLRVSLHYHKVIMNNDQVYMLFGVINSDFIWQSTVPASCRLIPTPPHQDVYEVNMLSKQNICHDGSCKPGCGWREGPPPSASPL